MEKELHILGYEGNVYPISTTSKVSYKLVSCGEDAYLADFVVSDRGSKSSYTIMARTSKSFFTEWHRTMMPRQILKEAVRNAFKAWLVEQETVNA
jgi:hypothetical protein